MVIEDLAHLLRGEVLEMGPADIFVLPPPGILAFRKDSPLHRFVGRSSFVLFQRVQVVGLFDEKKASDLPMSSSGLELPPDQKAFQMVSI